MDVSLFCFLDQISKEQDKSLLPNKVSEQISKITQRNLEIGKMIDKKKNLMDIYIILFNFHFYHDDNFDYIDNVFRFINENNIDLNNYKNHFFSVLKKNDHPLIKAYLSDFIWNAIDSKKITVEQSYKKDIAQIATSNYLEYCKNLVSVSISEDDFSFQNPIVRSLIKSIHFNLRSANDLKQEIKETIEYFIYDFPLNNSSHSFIFKKSLEMAIDSEKEFFKNSSIFKNSNEKIHYICQLCLMDLDFRKYKKYNEIGILMIKNKKKFDINWEEELYEKIIFFFEKGLKEKFEYITDKELLLEAAYYFSKNKGEKSIKLKNKSIELYDYWSENFKKNTFSITEEFNKISLNKVVFDMNVMNDFKKSINFFIQDNDYWNEKISVPLLRKKNYGFSIPIMPEAKKIRLLAKKQEENSLIALLGNSLPLSNSFGHTIKNITTEEMFASRLFNVQLIPYFYIFNKHVNFLIKNNLLTFKSLKKFLSKNTWYGEKSEKYDIPERFRPMLKNYFKNKKRNKQDYSLFINSMSVNFEYIFRAMSERTKGVTKEVKKDINGFYLTEKDINGLLSDEHIKKILTEDDLFYSKYILVEKSGYNLRHETSHALIPNNSFNEYYADLLMILFLKLSKYFY